MKTFASRFSIICIAVAALVSAPALAQQRPASAGPADPALIEDLIAANRILAVQGVVDAMGHVSVRHNRDPNRFLMALARAPELVTEADLMEYDLDSNPVRDPGRRQYSERYIHGEIYKLRPDVVAVVHAHTASVVPFTVSSVRAARAASRAARVRPPAAARVAARGARPRARPPPLTPSGRGVNTPRGAAAR